MWGGSAVNTILYYNTEEYGGNPNVRETSCQYVCISPLERGTGNVLGNPTFVNQTERDLRITTGSPCIDAGLGGVTTHDLYGVPRPLDGNTNGVPKPDIGAYEFIHADSDSDGDSLSDQEELEIVGTDPTRSDSDGDGALDGHELVAGTDPLDASDTFRLHVARGALPEDPLRMEWNGIQGRFYQVQSAHSLTQEWTLLPGATSIPGSNRMIVITNALPTPQQQFYRIRVTLD